MRTDPFAALGLPPRAGLSDDDVRAAWRRVAAATHPDREDGGDPARYSEAAAAYDTLRTSFGRGEALADLTGHSRRARPSGPGRAGRRRRARRLAGRTAVAVIVTTAAVLAAGWTPATVGVLAGALTWLAVTGLPGHGER